MVADRLLLAMGPSCWSVAVTSLVLVATQQSFAGSLLSDDFERAELNPDVNNPVWVGKNGTTDGSDTYLGLHGQIVLDPLDASNRVLSFTHTNSNGDAFCAVGLNVQGGTTYIVTFDYLGSPPLTTTEGNGGFIGLCTGLPSGAAPYWWSNWLAGTHEEYIRESGLKLTLDPALPADRMLDDDGTWHSYVIRFTPNTNMSLRLMIEDFSTSRATGDAFFDNVSLTVVPVPAGARVGAIMLVILGLATPQRR